MGSMREPFVSGTDVVLGRGLGASLRDILAKTPKAKTSRSFLGPLAVVCAQPHQVVSSTFGFFPAGSGLPAPALTLGPLALIGAFQWPLENHQAGMSVGN